MSYTGGGGGTSRISTSADVALNNPATSEVLTYDAALGKWKNQTTPANTGAVMVPRNSDNTWPTRPSATVVTWIDTNPAAPKVPNGMVNGDLYFGPNGMTGLAAGGTP